MQIAELKAQEDALMAQLNDVRQRAFKAQLAAPAPPAWQMPGLAPAQPDFQAIVMKRLEAIEQVLAPQAMSQAAQAGAAVMSAIGAGMSDEQAAWVKSRLDGASAFFTSSACKGAVGIFLQQWQMFEEQNGHPKAA